MLLKGKKILLGICGSIAAYKSAILIRCLVKEGAEVKVLATVSASSFISNLTLSALSKNPVYTEFVKDETGVWINHVALGLWADFFVIAPATANTIAKCANGLCDNLLTAVYLSSRCPVLFAPAMDLDMYSHPSVQSNLSKLKEYKNLVLEAEFGELASGLIGTGRMAEPVTIVKRIQKELGGNDTVFKNRKVLITAGPTYEPIDPVRFIGNRSTGKMGYAIAEVLAKKGADVTIVSGPVNLSVPEGVKKVAVEKAEEMFKEAEKLFATSDIAIFAAAVADFSPKEAKFEKIKKGGAGFTLSLERTKDIAEALGKLKKPGQITVGFALETENEEENAKEKLLKKQLDLIVLNSLKDEGAGFSGDTNKVSIFSRDNKVFPFELKSKKEVASDIVDVLTTYLK